MKRLSKRLCFSSISVLIILSILIPILVFSSCERGKQNKLVIWTYDSFVSEWGPAEPLRKLWETRGGIPVEFVSKGDSGALMGALVSKAKDADVDIVIGLDDRLAPR
ncbi:MAG TPA: thiamine ABC transporter substrate-binding protein, partial [Rectinemataceae bacterium]